MDPKETGCKDVDWIHSAQDMDQQQQDLVNMVLKLWVSLKVGNFPTTWVTNQLLKKDCFMG